MIYCNCYQRFKKFDFEIDATLKKIKKKKINIGSLRKNEGVGHENIISITCQKLCFALQNTLFYVHFLTVNVRLPREMDQF